MILSGIFISVLAITASTASRLPKGKSHSHIRLSQGSPIQLNEDVIERSGHPNTMIRRRLVINNDETLQPNLNDYNIKIIRLDDIKSLDGEGLEIVLENIDVPQKPRRQKKQLGFKVINVDDLNQDLNSNKQSINKLKFLQSLTPPEQFFTQYGSDQSTQRGQELASHLLESFSPKKKVKKFGNMYGYDSKKRNKKSIFDANGMMFLTKPKDTDDRMLGSLINKVMQYKANEGKKGLRQPTKVFTNREIRQIKKLARAIDEEDDRNNKNYELDELMQQEQERIDQEDAKSQEQTKTLVKLGNLIPILGESETRPVALPAKPIKILLADDVKPLPVQQITTLVQSEKVDEDEQQDRNDRSDEAEEIQINENGLTRIKYADATNNQDVSDPLKYPLISFQKAVNRENENRQLKKIARAIGEDPRVANKIPKFKFEDLVS